MNPLARVPGLALASLVAAAVLASGLPGAAQAHIGNPMKKMKEKLEKKAESQVAPQASDDGSGPPVFDDVTVEITEARVGGILKAYSQNQKLAAERAALMDKLNKISEEHGKVSNDNADAIGKLRERRDEVAQCTGTALGEIRDRKSEEYAKHALTDPAIREKNTKAAAQYNAAAAKGDSSAISKLQSILAGEILPDHDDTLAVQKKCGTPPPPSPAEVRLEKLEKDMKDMNEQIRAKDEEMAAQSETDHSAGLNRQQFAMALERIQLYLAAKKAKQKPKQITDEEMKVIEKHRAEIEKTMAM